MKKIDIFLLAFLGILIIFTIFAAIDPNIGTYFALENWFNGLSETSEFWSVVGVVCLICFIGAILPIPVPYAIPVATYSGIWYLNYSNPWSYILGLVLLSASSNAIGDAIDYIIGNGAHALISKEQQKQVEYWRTIIMKRPKWIPVVIFTFGISPLPESLLLPILGLVNYDFKKTVFFMFLGKIGQMLMFAIAGILVIQPILDSVAGGSWVSGMILLYVVWALITFMIKKAPKAPVEKDPAKGSSIPSTEEKKQ